MAKTYHHTDAVEFKQTPGKKFALNPAFHRHLPDSPGKTVLDVGCGDGYYSAMCQAKGLVYTGIDISSEMIAKAKSNFPTADFRVGSCLELAKDFPASSFDIVISSMLFPEFANKSDFDRTLKEVFTILKPGGIFLLGSAHPSFDMYMRKYLLNSPNVETDFDSYFDSAKEFKVKSAVMDITFEDHHWTFQDYINSLIMTGFNLEFVDECQVVKEAKNELSDYRQRLALPSYILFKAVKSTTNTTTENIFSVTPDCSL